MLANVEVSEKNVFFSFVTYELYHYILLDRFANFLPKFNMLVQLLWPN